MKLLTMILMVLLVCSSITCNTIRSYKGTLEKLATNLECEFDPTNKYYLCSGEDEDGHLLISVYSKELNKEIIRKSTGSFGSASWSKEGKVIVTLLTALPQINQTTYDYYLNLNNGDLTPIKTINHENQ